MPAFVSFALIVPLNFLICFLISTFLVVLVACANVGCKI